jgi:rhodanese-related sulfurtransferase
VTAEELDSALVSGRAPVIVDVRSRAEFRSGHVPGAINRPFWALAFSPPRQPGPLVLYCGHGPRAHIAKALLRLRGVHDVSLLEGHMAGWRRDGRPEEAAR